MLAVCPKEKKQQLDETYIIEILTRLSKIAQEFLLPHL